MISAVSAPFSFGTAACMWGGSSTTKTSCARRACPTCRQYDIVPDTTGFDSDLFLDPDGAADDPHD